MSRINENKMEVAFVFITLAVLLIGADWHTAKFLMETTDDGNPIFLVGFGVVCAVFFAWFCIKSSKASRRYVALGCKLVALVCMVLCAVAINSYKKEVRAEEDAKVQAVMQKKTEQGLKDKDLAQHEKEVDLKVKENESVANAVTNVKRTTGSTKLASQTLEKIGSNSANAAASPTPAPEDEENVRAAAGLKRKNVDYGKSITHWFADFARGPITWFPALAHAICFGIFLVTIVLTVNSPDDKPAKIELTEKSDKRVDPFPKGKQGDFQIVGGPVYAEYPDGRREIIGGPIHPKQ